MNEKAPTSTPYGTFTFPGKPKPSNTSLMSKFSNLMTEAKDAIAGDLRELTRDESYKNI